jgi:glycosyltransferase involved in cell wall biosynthesis
MHRYYSAADLFAFPGIRESLGMVYLEAQSCGLPVVAFRGWGVPEVVDDGGTGLLTEPFEHDAFAAAVRELVRNPDRRREMGRRAMARIRDIHDLERNYAQVDEALHELHTRHLAKRALLA